MIEIYIMSPNEARQDLFPVNMHMVKLDEKKVLVQPSPKGKEVVRGEEQPLRMIKPKTPKTANGRRMRGASHSDTPRPPSTSSWPSTRKVGLASGVTKTRPSGIPKRTI
jgi:hypothetical protein